MLNFPDTYPMRKADAWRVFAIVMALVLTQLFVQVHAVGHLDELAEEHEEGESCSICLVGNGVDDAVMSLGSIPLYLAKLDRLEPVFFQNASYTFRNAYAVRAPPANLQFR